MTSWRASSASSSLVRRSRHHLGGSMRGSQRLLPPPLDRCRLSCLGRGADSSGGQRGIISRTQRRGSLVATRQELRRETAMPQRVPPSVEEVTCWGQMTNSSPAGDRGCAGGPLDASHAHLPGVARPVTANVDAIGRDRGCCRSLGVAASAYPKHARGESRRQQANRSSPRVLTVQ